MAGSVTPQQRQKLLAVRSPAVLGRVWSVATGVGWPLASAQAGAFAIFAWPPHHYCSATAGCASGLVSEAAPCACVELARQPLELSELGGIYT